MSAYQVSTFQRQGRRQTQDDRCVVAPIGEGQLLGIFDGHGGSAVAERAAERVIPLFEVALTGAGDIGQALRTTVAGLVTELAHGCPEAGYGRPGGTTATLAYLTQERVGIAVLGDSPALLTVGKNAYIAPEHCVELCPADVERIQITHADQLGSGELRVVGSYLMLLSNMRALMLTRSIGDPEFEGVLIREPWVDVIERPAGAPLTLVIGSDGIRTAEASGDADYRRGLYAEYLELAARGGASAIANRIGDDLDDNTTVIVARTGI